MPLIRTQQLEPEIASVIIDRPEQRNALSIAVREEMCDTLDQLADDDTTRVVIISSVGPVFCAGFDLTEFADEQITEQLWQSSNRWHERLRSFPLPLIAAVQGPALAGGFDLATMCDLRVAASSATFGRPEVTWASAIYSILHDLIGGARARELTFTNRTLGASEALAIGLVTQLVDDSNLTNAALLLAREVAQAPRPVLAATKATVIHAAQLADTSSFAW